MNIYAGNLPYSVDEGQLRELFAQYGTVTSAKIIMDRDTQRPKGFGFVEMPSQQEATAAIEALDGTDLGGRPLRINEARPREDRPRGGGGGRW